MSYVFQKGFQTYDAKLLYFWIKL